MVEENDLRTGLLGQMDKDHGNASGAGTEVPRDIIERDSARVRRLKWVVIVCWSLVVMLFVVGGIIESSTKGGESNVSDLNSVWVSVAAVVLRAMLLIAVVLTISLYIRSRTLTMRQIHVRLASIEEHLRKMSNVN